MKNYIQSTLEDVDARIAELQALRDSLVRHFAGDEAGIKPLSAPAVAKPRARKPKAAASRTRAPVAPAAGGDDEAGAIRVGSVQHTALVAARKYADPFTAEQIAEVGGHAVGEPTPRARWSARSGRR